MKYSELEKQILKRIMTNVKFLDTGGIDNRDIVLARIILYEIKATLISWDVNRNEVIITNENNKKPSLDIYKSLIDVIYLIQEMETSGYILLVNKPKKANAIYDFDKFNYNSSTEVLKDKNGNTMPTKYSRFKGLAIIVEKIANSYVFPTRKLVDYVQNDFQTKEQLQHEIEMTESRKQTKYSRRAFYVAIIALLISFITLITTIIFSI